MVNRGPEAATLHVLPTLWFRNTWTWWPERPKPSLQEVRRGPAICRIDATHSSLGDYTLHCEGNPSLLFTENDTNNERFFGTPNTIPYVKDAIGNYVVAGWHDAGNPNRMGPKAAAHYQVKLVSGGTAVIRLQLNIGTAAEPFGNQFDQVADQRRRQANAFYQAKTPPRIGQMARRTRRRSAAPHHPHCAQP